MHTDEGVIDAVRKRVAAGDYRDQLPGKPGVGEGGPGWFAQFERGQEPRRVFVRGSEEYEAARARGLIDALPPLQPASSKAVAEIEGLIGGELPPLLRRLYVEVGNGGFGPGYGLLGLTGGYGDDIGRTATDHYRLGTFPAGLLPLCEWGDAIYSLVDVGSGEVYGFEPVADRNPAEEVFPLSLGLAEWLAKWVGGELRQPLPVTDPDTGAWRDATDAEYATWLAEL